MSSFISIIINQTPDAGCRFYLKVKINHLDEDNAWYLFRKAVTVQNENVKVNSVITPQLYNRFNEPLRPTFLKRKERPDLKTQIRLGDRDL